MLRYKKIQAPNVQGASSKHTKNHAFMQRLMQKHRYAHRGQLWANNSVEVKPCAVARACRCISAQSSENTWLCSHSNTEHCDWPDNRWATQAETHRNVFFLLAYGLIHILLMLNVDTASLTEPRSATFQLQTATNICFFFPVWKAYEWFKIQ